MRSALIMALISCIAAASPLRTAGAGEVPDFSIELEGGAVWQNLNDIEIPNDGTATRFSAAPGRQGGCI